MSEPFFALRWLVRIPLLCLWSLVAWGALLLLVTLGAAASEGPRLALSRLLPSHGASAWTWLNALSVGLAIGVGVVAVGLVAWRRGAGRSTPS